MKNPFECKNRGYYSGLKKKGKIEFKSPKVLAAVGL